MSRPSVDDVREWVGLMVQGPDGQEIGRCTRAYADEDTGAAEWLLVRPYAGVSDYFVPTHETRRNGDVVVVPWSDALVFTSPTFGSPRALTAEDEERLYRHYDVPSPLDQGLGGAAGSGDAGTTGVSGAGEAAVAAAKSAAQSVARKSRLVRLAPLRSAGRDGDGGQDTEEPGTPEPPAQDADLTRADGSDTPTAAAAAGPPDAPAPAAQGDAAGTSAEPTTAAPAPTTPPAGTMLTKVARGVPRGAVPVAGALASALAVLRLVLRRRQSGKQAQRRRVSAKAAVLVPAVAAGVLALRTRRKASDAAPQVVLTEADVAVPGRTAPAAPEVPGPGPVPAGGPFADADQSAGEDAALLSGSATAAEEVGPDDLEPASAPDALVTDAGLFDDPAASVDISSGEDARARLRRRRRGKSQ